MMSKILLSILIFIALITSSKAQLLPGGAEKPYYSESRALSMDSTFFMDVQLKLSDYDNKLGYDLGLKFGTFVKNFFSVSLGLNYLLSQNIFIGDRGEFLTLFYAGITPELVLKTRIIPGLYLFANSYIGGGYADYSTQTDFIAEKPMTGNWFLLAEPSIGLYQQITKDIVISLSAGQRFSSNIEMINLRQSTFDGRYAMLSLRVLIYSE